MKHIEWVKTYLKKQAGEADVMCPCCGETNVAFVFIGNRETKMGYAIVWCEKCLKGAHISRAKAALDQEIVPMDEAEETLNKLPEIHFTP